MEFGSENQPTSLVNFFFSLPGKGTKEKRSHKFSIVFETNVFGSRSTLGIPLQLITSITNMEDKRKGKMLLKIEANQVYLMELLAKVFISTWLKSNSTRILKKFLHLLKPLGPMQNPVLLMELKSEKLSLDTTQRLPWK